MKKTYIIESEPGVYTIGRSTSEPNPFLCEAPADFPADLDDANVLDVTGEGASRVFTVNADRVAAKRAEKAALEAEAAAFRSGS
jgi:hypothetical protein